MTRQTLWRTLIVALALTLASAGLKSFAQTLPGQSEDVEGTLLSNNLMLPTPLQVPLPLRIATFDPMTSNPPSGITSSTPLPSSPPLEATEAAQPPVNPPSVIDTPSVAPKAPVTASTKPVSTTPTATSKPANKPTIIKKPANKPTIIKKPVNTVKKPKRTTTVPTRNTSSSTRTTSSRASTRSGPSYFLKSTGYNSAVNQTDSSPRITATGARTRFGVIALSRDMLGSIPYGSQVTLEDMGVLGSGAGRGRFNSILRGIVFIVEDTMNARITRTVDVWFHSRSLALRWGKRQVKLTVLRFGRR